MMQDLTQMAIIDLDYKRLLSDYQDVYILLPEQIPTSVKY